MSVRPASDASNVPFLHFSTNSLSESQIKRPLQAEKQKRLTGDDRFIPSRGAMREAKSMDTFELDSPKTLYQKNCIQQLYPHYSERTLLYSQPKKYEFDHKTPKPRWQFPQKEERVLDAPDASDDFYKNSLDWGKQLLAVNLGKTSYLWKQSTGQTIQNSVHGRDLSSLKWSPSSCLLACGDMSSSILITDVAAQRTLFQLPSYDGAAVYSMDWRSEHELTFGTIGSIYHMDIRRARPIVWTGNCVQSVCSLSWNKDDRLLASGSNANQVQIFDIRNPTTSPVHAHFHRAAVKGLQWVEGSSHLLLSGGGTVDKIIKLYDTRKKMMLCEAFVGAQITSVTCLDDRYFVLGLGYSDPRNIQLWRYLTQPEIKLEMVASVAGQAGRILGLTKNPESAEICSLSNRETLYFWMPVKSVPSSRRNPEQNRTDGSYLPPLIR